MGIFCQVFKSELQTSYKKYFYLQKHIKICVSKQTEIQSTRYLTYNTRGVNFKKKTFYRKNTISNTVCEIRLKLNIYHTLLNMFYLI